MPRLPEEVPQEAFGGEIGRAVENVGSVAQQHVDAVMTLARHTQLTEADNQFKLLTTNLTHDPKTGAFTKLGKDAFGLNQQYLPQFDQRAQQIVDNVPDPRARVAARLAAQQYRGMLGEQLDSHELQQHKEYAANTAQASVKLSIQQAADNYNHPDIISSNLDTVGISLESLGHQLGWSPEQIQEETAQARSTLHANVLDRMLADDKIPMAKVYLESAKHDMEASRVEAVARTIDARLKEKQNELKQDIADRFQDSMTAAQYGLPNAVTVSRREMDILYPKDAQRRWDGLQSMVEAGAQAKKYDQMTPQEILDDLQSRQPKQGGPEAAFQIHNYETLSRAAQQSIQARSRDPAQFAIDSGTGWKPLNLGNSAATLAELRSRANSLDMVSEQVGTQVPLLTHVESKQLSAALDGAPPAKRVDLLAGLHQSLPNEQAYYSVMREIAPHSPVTAIVGARVGDPVRPPLWYNSKFGLNTADAERILTGEALLNPPKGDAPEKGGFKEGIPMPPEAAGSGLRSYFADQTADLFRGRPQLADAYYSAFRAAYAGLAAEQGDYSGAFVFERRKQAYQMVMGHIQDVNGQPVMVPQGMDPSHFKSLVDKAVASAAPAYGAPKDWRDRIGGYQLRELDGVGSGRYELVNGNAPLMRPDKKGPFVIDLHAQYQSHP